MVEIRQEWMKNFVDFCIQYVLLLQKPAKISLTVFKQACISEYKREFMILTDHLNIFLCLPLLPDLALSSSYS